MPRRQALLSRTDPHVAAIARHVIDTALDASTDPDARPARRAGVMRTTSVATRTTLLLVRFRFHLQVPVADGLRQLVAEDARTLAFTGPPDSPTWLTDDDAAALLTAQPGGNVPADQAHALAERVIDGLPSLDVHLDETADALAGELLESHRRVRSGARAARRGLSVKAQKPADILGVYVYLPVMSEKGASR